MRGLRAPPAIPLASLINVVRFLFASDDVFESGEYVITGGETRDGVPENSSAPISGVESRVSPSKSLSYPEIPAAPLSICVGVAGLMCRNAAAEPLVLRNGGFSVTETESRGAATRALKLA